MWRRGSRGAQARDPVLSMIGKCFECCLLSGMWSTQNLCQVCVWKIALHMRSDNSTLFFDGNTVNLNQRSDELNSVALLQQSSFFLSFGL